jgi:flagellar hook-associated protein 2
MAGAINFSGLSSGIDTNAIISELATLERQPETLLQSQQTTLQQKQAAYGTVSAALLNLQSAATTLDLYGAFNLVTGTTSDNTVATISAQTGAQTGSHTLTVSQLATAQEIGSAPQTSQTAPLNFSGQIIINGKAINVQSADSLQTLASDINSAKAGVTASIISPSQGQYYLTIGSANSGVQGQISLSDVGGGNLLSQLGFFSSSGGTITHQLSGSVGSDLFSDSATSVATLLGETTPSSGTVQIKIGSNAPVSVNIDLSQSLTTIANNINNALGSSAATVVTVTDPISGTSKQQLQIANATGFTDSNNVLANLGIYEKSIPTANVLQKAQDASFTLDGLSATRPTNSFSDAISGVTINLLKDASGNSGVSPSTSLTVSPDTSTITTNINAFVTAFNTAIDTINNSSTYDSTTGATGVLFGDSTTSGIVDNLVTTAGGAVTGLPSALSALSQIGITLDPSGNDHLDVDSAALASALSSNLSGVAKLFQASGVPTNPQIQYVTATSTAKPSSATGYAVQITAPATQATYTASVAQTQPLLTDETLSFGGPLFGSSSTAPLTGYAITLKAGSTAAGIVSQINADSTLGATVSASLNGSGQLQLTSKQYGSAASFSVASTVGAANNSSGVGNSVQTVSGTDVQGSINGETATGQGQFLTGSQQGGQASGLEIRVTATSAGSYGNIVYTSGIADSVKNYTNTLTDPYTGILTLDTNDFQSQYNDLQTDIANIEAQVSADQQLWLLQFTNMETTVANLKSASAGLVTLSSGGTTTSSSSSSSASSNPGTIG